MRNDLVKKNIIIITIGLLLFYVLSIFSTSAVSRNSLEQQLINVSKIIYSQVEEATNDEELYKIIDSYTINQDWLRIVVADSTGLILKDSTNDSVGNPYYTYLEENEIKLIDNHESEFKKTYISEEEICFITKLNDNYILRTSVVYESDTELILTNLFYMLLLIILVIVVSFLLTKKTSDNIINTFNNISAHLKTINEGEYIDINVNHKYPEVSEVLEEINDVNTNISNSLLKIKNEHSKTNFIINNMEQGILIVNTNNEVLIINDYAKNALDINIKKAYNMKCSDVINNELLLKRISSAIEFKNNYYFDLDCSNKEKIYACSITHLSRKWSDIEKNEDLVVVLITDVTDERTNDKIKAEFISNASHELKTPITSIRGFAELLLVNKEKNDDRTNKYLNIIYNESIKMKETIDELLYLSNLEYHRTTAETLEQLNLKQLILEILDDYEDLAFRNKVSFEVKLSDVVIYEQEKLIKHLFSNLIENAIKYNKENGIVKIEITEEENCFNIIVEDTGIGIDEKYIDKIFQRFYRIDESHNRNTGGSGIGLNIVKQICATINAKIEVQSTLNVGTKFIVRLNKNE